MFEGKEQIWLLRIISLGQVHGAEVWLIGWAVCVIAYFATLLPMKNNRGNAKNVLFRFLIAEMVTDLCRALVYYDNSVYLNYGIGAVCGLLLWPVVLIVAGIIATMQNKNVNRQEDVGI